MTPKHTPRRAVGVVRVSRVGGRDADHGFVSPSEQRARIENACRTSDLELVAVYEELDVSAGKPIAKRPGVSAALAKVEAGVADTVVVAYFDRLFRSLRVQGEIVERVERAGGSILAVDVGHVRADTASHWLSSTLLGAVAEYHRRMTAERSVEGSIRCVAAGVAPFPKMPVGYQRGADRRIEVHPEHAPIVREAFELRANGESWHGVRRHLASHGIMRSTRSVAGLIGSRMVLGELRFGQHTNLESHPPIVERELWERAQRPGRRFETVPGPKSGRLLSHLRLLRCASCGNAMVLGSQKQHGRIYPMYKCPVSGSCERRVTIAAEMVEGVVIDRVREILADESASASASAELAAARADVEAAQTRLDRAIDTLAGFDDVAAARQKLHTLRAELDAARDRAAELGRAAGAGLTINAAADWDALTLAERRELISAVLRRVEVHPGRGTGRVRIVAVGEPGSE